MKVLGMVHSNVIQIIDCKTSLCRDAFWLLVWVAQCMSTLTVRGLWFCTTVMESASWLLWWLPALLLRISLVFLLLLYALNNLIGFNLTSLSTVSLLFTILLLTLLRREQLIRRLVTHAIARSDHSDHSLFICLTRVCRTILLLKKLADQKENCCLVAKGHTNTEHLYKKDFIVIRLSFLHTQVFWIRVPKDFIDHQLFDKVDYIADQ